MTYYDDHSAMYMNTESLHCTSETNMSYANYISIFKIKILNYWIVIMWLLANEVSYDYPLKVITWLLYTCEKENLRSSSSRAVILFYMLITLLGTPPNTEKKCRSSIWLQHFFYLLKFLFYQNLLRTPLVVQEIRMHPPKQGVQIQPLARKTSRAAEQQGPGATTTEVRVPAACAPRQQKTPQWEALPLHLEGTAPCSLQLEKASEQQPK